MGDRDYENEIVFENVADDVRKPVYSRHSHIAMQFGIGFWVGQNPVECHC